MSIPNLLTEQQVHIFRCPKTSKKIGGITSSPSPLRPMNNRQHPPCLPARLMQLLFSVLGPVGASACIPMCYGGGYTLGVLTLQRLFDRKGYLLTTTIFILYHENINEGAAISDTPTRRFTDEAKSFIIFSPLHFHFPNNRHICISIRHVPDPNQPFRNDGKSLPDSCP